MRIAVLVPTYRRPRDLTRCLRAIATQTRAADEVVVVGRRGDAATWTVLESPGWTGLHLKSVAVDRPGQVHALNSGVSATTSEVVAITDDDAAPRPDWLVRIEDHFQADPSVGGVGGRDWVHVKERIETGDRLEVGKVRWHGWVVGNHHLGAGGSREVDVLKGANCAYRGTLLRAIGFDERLRGCGAQVHNDMALALSVRRAGWKLIYDPAMAVDHYPAERHDEDARDGFSFSACSDNAHNHTLILLEHLPPWERVAYLLWVTVIGTRAFPGLAQWLRIWPTERSRATAKLRATVHGRIAGWNTWRRHEGARVAKALRRVAPAARQ